MVLCGAMDLSQFESRKSDHLKLALNPENQAQAGVALGRIRLVHEALPELDLRDVDLRARCLGFGAKTPFYVAGMTAGHASASRINRTLAEAALARGWVMGVGSQRRELDAVTEAETGAVDDWDSFRRDFDGLFLIANIGASQLARHPVDSIRRLVDGMGARALAVHLNSLQEALQPEGTPFFSGVTHALHRLCAALGVPVIVKETGCGFSEPTLRRLRETGVAAVDVSGLGGTHWGRIEGRRAPAQSVQAGAAETFADWGISTVESVRNAVRAQISEIWASGGVRSGLDAAKLIALGAHRVGYAQPALHAALAGPAELDAWMARQEYELRVALFCTGSASVEALRLKKGVYVEN